MFYTSVICRESVSFPELLHEAETTLSQEGILKQEPNGFTYLDVDDGYLTHLGEWIKKDGFEIPPYLAPGLAGAHITLVRPPRLGEELFSKKATPIEPLSLPQMDEVGETFSFSLKGCEIVKPRALPNVESLFIITVHAPRLEELIDKYHLPHLGFDFHITIGMKSRK